jgi:hypothetical protein
MESETETPTRRGITRRDVLKRGAVIGGVVWAVPVIDTVMASPAFAGSIVHYCCYCYDEVDANNCGTVANPSDGGLNDFGTADGHPTSASACACSCSQLGYTQYQWGGPSPNAYTAVTGTTGATSNGGPVCGCIQLAGTPVMTSSGPALCPPV